MLSDFGQPLGSIAQFAYVVRDAEREMLRYAERLRLGPWFVRGPFQPPEGLYRGQPTHATFTIAHAFAGHAMVELIEQHDDAPSVFNERDGDGRYGFHHWGSTRRRSTTTSRATRRWATRRRTPIASPRARAWCTSTRRATFPE